ncbi:MAG: 16S rRNA (guanine(966)-N(2))-methyltransferase RsmD [Gammaproteobacteria bacterium]|nr:16S rRNA (guanine(966)-N(2))-methyltransferase RsmD [Gammaproteobacteria bacterium]
MKPGKLRIIGGEWRGRRLPVADGEGLRPTPDRIRETLFNWLAPYINGARCLDLFAGSGALGLEAASRGAAEVVMVDSSSLAVEVIRNSLRILGATGIEVSRAEARSWLEDRLKETDYPHHYSPHGFDIVFLDPPFRKGLLAEVTELLEQGNWLAPGAHIYLETEKTLPEPQLPGQWHLMRKGKAGQVRYYLATNRGEHST